MGLAGGVLVRFLLGGVVIEGGLLGGTGKKMTISMSVQEQIRRLDADGVPARQIARELGVSRDSVAKYVAEQDFSPRPVVVHRRPGGSVDKLTTVRRSNVQARIGRLSSQQMVELERLIMTFLGMAR